MKLNQQSYSFFVIIVISMLCSFQFKWGKVQLRGSCQSLDKQKSLLALPGCPAVGQFLPMCLIRDYSLVGMVYRRCWGMGSSLGWQLAGRSWAMDRVWLILLTAVSNWYGWNLTCSNDFAKKLFKRSKFSNWILILMKLWYYKKRKVFICSSTFTLTSLPFLQGVYSK